MAKTVHIMCGLPGSGKSTRAIIISEKNNAVIFSFDEWMADLLGDNYSDEDFERFVLPCQNLIWKASIPLIDRGHDVVYDFAVYSKHGRRQLFEKIRDYGAYAIIHYLNIPYSVCKKRLLKRNESKKTYEAKITSEKFDLLSKYFVPPSEDEGFQIITIINT